MILIPKFLKNIIGSNDDSSDRAFEKDTSRDTSRVEERDQNVSGTGNSTTTNTPESGEAEPEEMQESSEEVINPETEDEDGRGVPDIGEYHRDLISPRAIIDHRSYAKVGKDYVKTMFANSWPDVATDGLLEGPLFDSNVRNDIAIHLDPYDATRAEKIVEREFKKAESRAKDAQGSTFTTQEQKQKELEETKKLRDAFKGNSKLFDASMYFLMRGESEAELKNAESEMVKKLKTAPTHINPATLINRQKEGMQAVSPIGADPIGRSTEMLGGAAAALFPATSKSIVEEEGVDYGIHYGNGSPVIIDRWQRQNGYNQFTVGKIGSGKSFSTQLNLLRSYVQREDVIIYMLDPLGEFKEITETLNGERIMIGGKTNLNPLKIEETPEHVLEEMPDLDPYNVAKSKVMEFFEKYFHQRGQDLGDKNRGVLERAVEVTYNRKGITRDIDTHSKDSPVIGDLIETLTDMVENPEEFVEAESESHIERLETSASEVLIALEQFKSGQEYENLSGESDIEVTGEEVVYFDLSQKEGSGEIGLMMQLLFSEIWEHSKKTDKKVLFAIDEAHYLMSGATLDFLETVVRHSRHVDLGINFITQEIHDFFNHEKAETIVNNCDIRLFQRIQTSLAEGELDALGLNDAEHQYIKQAAAGDREKGFSEALLGVGDYGYVPLQVKASNLEAKIIEGEEGLAELADRKTED